MIEVSSIDLFVFIVLLLFWFQHQLWLPTVNPPYDKRGARGGLRFGAVAGWFLRPTFWRCSVLVLQGMAVGAGQEWRQSWLPGRVASVEDWLVDVAGLLVGCCLAGSGRAKIRQRLRFVAIESSLRWATDPCRVGSVGMALAKA